MKFLAIGFHQAGFHQVTERGVQGVDVDASNGCLKYSTEVKTTLGTSVWFQAKDACGLAKRQADGYQPLLGVLRLSPLADWFLVSALALPVGRLELDVLRPHRLLDLEECIRPRFADVVAEHGESTLANSQAYLDRVLRELQSQA